MKMWYDKKGDLSMNDPYVYENSRVLKNLLNITDEKELDLAEAELSRANMMILYEQGFGDFSPEGLCAIHKSLFGDVYDWAGKYRIINIQKREAVLGGVSVWYANDVDIEKELRSVFREINRIRWASLSKQDFIKKTGTVVSADLADPSLQRRQHKNHRYASDLLC